MSRRRARTVWAAFGLPAFGAVLGIVWLWWLSSRLNVVFLALFERPLLAQLTTARSAYLHRSAAFEERSRLVVRAITNSRRGQMASRWVIPIASTAGPLGAGLRVERC